MQWSLVLSSLTSPVTSAGESGYIDGPGERSADCEAIAGQGRTEGHREAWKVEGTEMEGAECDLTSEWRAD